MKEIVMNKLLKKIKSLFNPWEGQRELEAARKELQDALDVACREIIILKRNADPWWKTLDEEMARREADEAEYGIDVPFNDGPLSISRQKKHFEEQS